MKNNDLPSCGICSCKDVVLRYHKRDFSIAKCNSCGVLFRTPHPTFEEVRQLYTSTYYNPWCLENEEVVKRIKMETFEKRLREIHNYVSCGRILDVGCATGFFLEKAASKGFSPFGIELSEFSYTEAHKKFGNNVYHGTIEEAPFENNFFDVITMFDLFEHVKDPVTTLRRCKALLKPQGIIVAVLPDISSISARVMGKNWTHYKKEHLYYFSKRTISELLKQESYEVVKITPARKVMNLEYLYHQLAQYPHHIVTPLITTFNKLLPHYLCRASFPLSMGEMLIIARSGN